MERKRLSDLCDVRSGGTPSKSNPGFWTGAIPWISPKDMKSTEIEDATDHISEIAIESSAASTVPAQSILVVVRSGVLAHTLPVAKTLARVSFNQDIKALIPKPEAVDPDYLYWFVRSTATDVIARGVKKGATVHSVVSGYIERLQVPLPPRADQHRIVDLLSRAEGIVRLRREAQKKASELLPALVLDMFGDPASNPKGWAVKAIGTLCPVQTGATPLREEKRFYEGGTIPWVKTGEVSGSIFSIEERITESAVSETNCKVFPVNTILIAMYGQGQTRGRAGILRIPAASNQACAAVLPSDNINQAYLYEVLRMQYARLRAMGRGGNQANLNLTMIKTLQIPVPPTALQGEFQGRAIAISSIEGRQAAAMNKSQSTFNALLHRAFASV